MLKYSVSLQIGNEHIDRGNHANWRKQLEIAEDVLFRFRDEHGLGLTKMKEEDGLFFVMGTQKSEYRKQLMLGDVIDACLSVQVHGHASLSYHVEFVRDSVLVTEMDWIMPLILMKTGRPKRLPRWIHDAIDQKRPAEAPLHA